ncbi:MAG: arsenite methyltransferase [Clostridiales bacterium]|nr:arsenite methyltransferase [Eubacteriales bacterium]MDH7565770.1 arsenite methyltransferase [Clostridiales bacterium]
MDFNVKEKVREHYGKIAAKVSKSSEKASCCSGSCSCDGGITETSILYKDADLSALPKEAVDASLGCANPLVFAELKEGETVLDLGSGGGMDVLMAARHVGASGKVYGLDMTDEMLALANKNKRKMGAANVEFIKGYIEDIPLPNGIIDVILSNCVINLSEDKERALSEAYRVLKPGGRLAIADIVSMKPIPAEIKKQAEMWCGCLAGTLGVDEYKNILEKVGFTNVEIEPVHIYSKSLIEKEFVEHKYLGETVDRNDLDTIDGAFAGAYIKARK